MSRIILSILLWVLPPSELLDKAGELFDGQQWHQTIEVINESLPELRQSGDEETLAECLSMLSIAYFRLGAFSPAWDAQYECYQLDLASGEAGNISSSLNTLAGICLAMENYDEGERLIKEAISYEETLGQTEALAVRFGMASDILLKQNKVDEAIEYASRALEIDQAAGRPIKVAVRKSQLAAAYLEAGKLAEAGFSIARQNLFEASEGAAPRKNLPLHQACANPAAASDPKPMVSIMIGPEGDFSRAEVALALERGWQPVSLGDSRLRIETAALVATTAVYLHFSR